MSSHAVFLQRYYDDCPVDVMVGTIENPAYFVGYIEIQNGQIVRSNLPFLELVPKLILDGHNYNMYVEGYGLKRNLIWSKNSFSDLMLNP